MAYCTVQEIRDENSKLEDTDIVLSSVIENRISNAESIVKTDLNDIISESELDAIAENSEVIKLLTLYKAAEKTLVRYYGASRKVEDVSDIQYYQKQYKDLLNRILDGSVKITSDDKEYSPKDWPAVTKTNAKFYPRKGIPGFFEDGVTKDIYDDRVK